MLQYVSARASSYLVPKQQAIQILRCCALSENHHTSIYVLRTCSASWYFCCWVLRGLVKMQSVPPPLLHSWLQLIYPLCDGNPCDGNPWHRASKRTPVPRDLKTTLDLRQPLTHVHTSTRVVLTHAAAVSCAFFTCACLCGVRLKPFSGALVSTCKAIGFPCRWGILDTGYHSSSSSSVALVQYPINDGWRSSWIFKKILLKNTKKQSGRLSVPVQVVPVCRIYRKYSRSRLRVI